MYTTANPSFIIYIKVGFKGVYITRACYPDVYKFIKKNGYIIKGQQGSLWFTYSWQDMIHLDLKFDYFVQKTKSYWFH